MTTETPETLPDPVRYTDAPYTYLTTTGRKTGNPHTVEIWFALDPQDTTRLYMLAGGGGQTDWVRNLVQHPAVTLKLGETIYRATAAVVAPDDPADALLRQLLAAKYQGWQAGQPLSDWARTALPAVFILGTAAE